MHRNIKDLIISVYGKNIKEEYVNKVVKNIIKKGGGIADSNDKNKIFLKDEFGQNQFEPVDRICKKCATGEYLTTWNGMDCPSCGHFRMKHRRSDILWD
mgnify:CR=1 FL=1